MQYQTNRTFKNVENNEVFSLYKDTDTHEFSLIKDKESNIYAKGTEVNGFYLCAHSSCDIKINGKRIINLPQGTFYNVKEDEEITHKRLGGFKKFSKF